MHVKSYGVGAVSAAMLVAMGALLVPATADPPPTCNGLAATIVGTDGDDTTLTGTAGDDVVSLGAGNDSFRGGGGDDTVCGGPGRDSVYGEAGDDWLDGGDDADRAVVGGPGVDVVHGGAGDDERLSGDDSHVDGDEGDAYLVDSPDEVYGDDGNDDIRGEPGSGADLVDGGDGLDGIGFYLGGGSVKIDVVAGTATGRGAVDNLRGLEYYGGSEFADVITGSAGDDHLTGVYGDDVIDGRDGDDTLSAMGGTITGGNGRDTFLANEEANDHPMTVDLGPGDDRALLDALRDVRFVGGPGDDLFEVIEPGSGGLDPGGTYARLLGGAGEDVLTFADNHHRVRIDVRAGTATWWPGKLTFAHLNEFHGSTRDDVMLGSREDDRLFGQAGDDELRGRGGPDLLRGGTGRDTAYGGPGRDTCAAERRFSCERS